MRIAICDNVQETIDTVSLYINEWASSRPDHPDVKVMEFKSAEAFLFYWSSTTNFDLIFLDTIMEDMTGIELANVIRKIDKDLSIVFVTETLDHIFDGYEVEALHYLLKPVSQDSCFKCLDRAYAKLQKKNEHSLVLTTDRKLRRILYGDIIYIESRSHYIIVHTKQGKVKARKNISDVEAELDPQQFLRIHRSFIVNIEYIQEIHGKDLRTENDAVLSISKVKQKEVVKAFVQYHAQTTS